MKKVDTADMKTIRFTRLEVRALLLIISEFREKLIEDNCNTKIADDIIGKLTSR